MVKLITIAFGAIPAIVALLIVLPMINQDEIPITASNPNDKIELEYAKHQLKKVSFGVVERATSQQTEILLIENDGSVSYDKIVGSVPELTINSEIDSKKLKKLIALIKETGFITIPSDSFPIREDVDEYQKLSLKITLNGQTNQIFWPEQNATDKFVPPIMTLVEIELDTIIDDLIE